jgi:RNA polymerase sigma-70 factor (ECF subfamily)
VPPSEETRWFAEHVQPHEPALRAYLLSRFSTLPDHDDLVQETYLRMLRARLYVRLTTAKAFLFATAGHLAIDRFRRCRVARLVPLDAIGDLSAGELNPEAAELLDQRQRRELLAEAVAALPCRCRAVMLLRYSDGLSCKEIAERLGISTETVKSHLTKGVGDCIAFFQRHGLLERQTANLEKAI